MMTRPSQNMAKIVNLIFHKYFMLLYLLNLFFGMICV